VAASALAIEQGLARGDLDRFEPVRQGRAGYSEHADNKQTAHEKSFLICVCMDNRTAVTECSLIWLKLWTILWSYSGLRGA
jgi:hypothetical protein